MKLLVGLGNPGAEYADTRHNVGFRVLEAFARRRGATLRDDRDLYARSATCYFAERELTLLLPMTYMNRSGASVAAAARQLELTRPEQMLVVYDDLDLPFGRLRLRPRGGSGGHRGVADIQRAVGTNEFPRLRFGVGRPDDADADAVDHVLGAWRDDERDALESRVELAVQALECVCRDGITISMNRFNSSLGD